MDKERWSKDAIAQRVRYWNQRYGSPPKISDWRYSGADEDGAYPSETTVKGKFGSWNAGIQYAGVSPRSIGRPAQASISSTERRITWKDKDLPNAMSNTPNPYPYSYGWTGSPTYTCFCGAQSKLNAIKALIEQGTLDKDILLAVINA